MRTNKVITVYKKVKASGETIFRLLFSAPAHVAGSVKSNFDKGIKTADSFIIRIPSKSVTGDISKGDRVVIGTANTESISDARLTKDYKALTVTAIRDNSTSNPHISHIRLDCAR